jgi:GNAT superfamily N-acetyltransferase
VALSVRPAREADLHRADELVCASINEVTQRHGYGPFASPSPPRFQLFSLQEDPAGLWVAEEDDRLLGFAFSWVCGDLWFLAQLFVSPEQQGGGVGAELLKRTLMQAEMRACRHKALITFAFNRASQGLYLRHGLFPSVPIYFFASDITRVNARPSGSLRAEPLEDTLRVLRHLADVDGGAFGVSRAKHHRYLMADVNSHGFGLFAGSECVGYAYVSKSGHIGPLAVANDDILPDAFETALGLVVERGAPQASAFIPATARRAMERAVEQRMRITMPMMLMANDHFGQWTRYLPRNPGFT